MRLMSACLLLALVASARAHAQSTTTPEPTRGPTPASAGSLIVTAIITPAGREQVAPSTPAAAVAGPVASSPPGPSAAGARIGVAQPVPPLMPPPAPRRADTSRNRALMIVGGAALLVGAVIHGTPGTLVMLGGGLTGLYGLYKFLE